MKKIALIMGVIIICLSLTIGLHNITSIESLMRPPKLSGENRLLQQAFEKTVSDSDGIVMKNPLSGNYTSSYLFFDMNNDNIDEAFVFYSDLSEDNLACVSIFKMENDDWSFISKIKGLNEDFYEINFADINGDRNYEILLSFKATEQIESVNSTKFTTFGNHILSVYSFDNVSTMLLKTELYSDLYISDFNNDNCDDFFFVDISLSGQEKNTTGRILSFNEDYSVAQEQRFSLTGMLEIYNIATDLYKENNNEFTRIFIDGAISERGIITEIVSINHKDFSLSLPLYEQNHSTQPSTLRDSKIFSLDFDMDGLIEIPTLEAFPYAERISKGSNERTPLNLTVWNEFNSSGLSPDKKCVLNSSFDYLLIVDESWINTITAVYDYNNSTLTFYYINEDGTLHDEIFSLRAFSVPEWSEDTFGYTKLKENTSHIYAYKFFDNDIENDFEKYLNENFIVYK